MFGARPAIVAEGRRAALTLDLRRRLVRARLTATRVPTGLNAAR